MQNSPLISVIMPTYNSARFIAEAVQSVINQTYAHWELLIVDDASTDETRQIVEGFTDPRVRYFLLSQQQGYPSKVRNIGLSKAQGAFIGFLDSDDIFYPDALKLLIQALHTHPEWFIAQGYEILMSEDGLSTKPNPALASMPNGTWCFTRAHHPASVKALLRCQNPYLLGATLMRKEALEQIGLLNESMMSGEDQEYFLRAYLTSRNLETSQPIGVIPVPIYKYRQRQNSLVRNIAKKDQAIQDNINLLDWFFDSSHRLPREIQQLQGEIYINRYAYAAQALLLEGYSEQAKKWTLQSWKAPKRSKLFWMKKIFPLLIRCALPLTINQQWEKLHQWSRNFFFKVKFGHA